MIYPLRSLLGSSSIRGRELLTSCKDARMPGLYRTASVYSGSDVSTPEGREYIAQMASDLFNCLEKYEFDSRTLKRISERIPDLLRAFSVRVAYGTQPQIHRDVAYFVRKHRG